MPRRRTSQVRPRRITQGTREIPRTTRISRYQLNVRNTTRTKTDDDDRLSEDGGRGKTPHNRDAGNHEVVTLTVCRRRALYVPERRRMTATQETLQHIEDSL